MNICFDISMIWYNQFSIYKISAFICNIRFKAIKGAYAHGKDGNHDDYHINYFRFFCFGNQFHVTQSWYNQDNWNPQNCTWYAEELIQFRLKSYRAKAPQAHYTKSTNVFKYESEFFTIFADSSKNEAFEDFVGGIDGQWIWKYQIDAVHQLGDFDYEVGLTQIVDDYRLFLSTEVFEAYHSKYGEINRQGTQRYLHHFWKLFGVSAFFHNWHDCSNAFKGIETEADHIPKLVWVEEFESFVLWTVFS